MLSTHTLSEETWVMRLWSDHVELPGFPMLAILRYGPGGVLGSAKIARPQSLLEIRRVSAVLLAEPAHGVIPRYLGDRAPLKMWLLVPLKWRFVGCTTDCTLLLSDEMALSLVNVPKNRKATNCEDVHLPLVEYIVCNGGLTQGQTGKKTNHWTW